MSEITKTSRGLSDWDPNETMQYEHFKNDNQIINGYLEDIESSKTDDVESVEHNSLKERLEAESQKTAELREMAQVEDVDNTKTYNHYTKFRNGHIVDVYEEVTE